MLRLVVSGDEFFNEADSTFSNVGDVHLDLEHSLVSLSKWESKYMKPFLGGAPKTQEETVGYIMAMILTPDVGVDIIKRLSQQNMDDINAYVESPATATTFGMMPERKGRGEVITAELIYYWLVAFNIPFEVETWHLNRLLALIKICNIKNNKPTKMSRAEIARRNAELNAQRKAQLGTAG